MCVIISLKPGYTLPYNMLETATYNNPHGYGLVLKDQNSKRLQVIHAKEKDFKEGNDPKEIYDLLKKNEDIERYLHLRWKTEGDITAENCQPFPAYISDSRQVFFMHNGTLNDFRPLSAKVKYENGVRVEEHPGETCSDSKKFNDTFLAPFLARFKGEQGAADSTDPVARNIINRFWSGDHNRGLIVTSDLDPVYINLHKWETIEADGGHFLASNNTYFSTLSRGPVYEQRKKEEEERKKKESEERARFQGSQASRANESVHVTKLKNLLVQDQLALPLNIKSLLHDVDVYSDEGISQLKNVTAQEWVTFVKNNDEDAVSLLAHVVDEFAVLYEKYTKITEHVRRLEGRTSRKEAKIG